MSLTSASFIKGCFDFVLHNSTPSGHVKTTPRKMQNIKPVYAPPFNLSIINPTGLHTHLQICHRCALAPEDESDKSLHFHNNVNAMNVNELK